MKKILFIGYGEPDPSSRYRAEQYFKMLKKFYSDKIYSDYFKIYPNFITKNDSNFLFFNIIVLIKKIYSIIYCLKFDVIFIQRNPVKQFSPYYELFIKDVLRKKLIFDFDDAIWLLYGEYDNRYEKVMQSSDLVIAGNKYLYNYAKKFNSNVYILNTVVDTLINKPHLEEREILDCINICWIGSKPNNEFLLDIEDSMKKLKKLYGGKIGFHFVSNEIPIFKDFSEYTFYKWSTEKEYFVLVNSDIGVMPLPNTPITQGKCGFKLIQYGSFGLASVASPIGINCEIIKDGSNGYLAKNRKEWFTKLNYLISHPRILQKMKINSLKIIESQYSLNSKKSIFINIVNNI